MLNFSSLFLPRFLLFSNLFILPFRYTKLRNRTWEVCFFRAGLEVVGNLSRSCHIFLSTLSSKTWIKCLNFHAPNPMFRIRPRGNNDPQKREILWRRNIFLSKYQNFKLLSLSILVINNMDTVQWIRIRRTAKSWSTRMWNSFYFQATRLFLEQKADFKNM